ncbi:MAG: bifunctional phosphoribosyl-AMP cyclohydrolase/phosphoribosyl-ATP diphosphatase HisIE [Solirubrobacterales bacterium]
MADVEPGKSAPEVRFSDDGLVPCVTQDSRTGEVLTLAWMSAESLRLTLDTGEVHFFSRSRGEIWRKGETSGNTQRVVDLRIDCDEDAVIALVEPAGPACHTGERSCFYRRLEDGGPPQPTSSEALAELQRTLDERAITRPEGSYTVTLLDNSELAAGKVMEEAEEVTRAVREESDERVEEETADVLYHLAVLLKSREITLDRAMEVLNGRRS